MLETKTNGYKDKAVNANPAENFDKNEMIVSKFVEYLTEKYGVTLNNKPFDHNYAHSIMLSGHLPRHYGGNLLRVRRVKGIKMVTILDEKFKFYNRGDYTQEVVTKKKS